MPPKSQTTSFLLSSNETSSDKIRQTQILFEFGIPSFSQGDDRESGQPNTLSATDQGEIAPATAPQIESKPVLRSAKVEPEVPQMTRDASRTLQIKQLWEGTVLELRGETFLAVLNDKSQPNSPAEQVEFESIELREDDWPLVVPGSVFYWMIGTERTPSGQVRNISNIEFSRLPLWTRSSLKAASEKGSRAAQWFHANGSCAS
jgi:hypothetical protein